MGELLNHPMEKRYLVKNKCAWEILQWEICLTLFKEAQIEQILYSINNKSRNTSNYKLMCVKRSTDLIKPFNNHQPFEQVS